MYRTFVLLLVVMIEYWEYCTIAQLLCDTYKNPDLQLKTPALMSVRLKQ